jgi:transposase-like protein
MATFRCTVRKKDGNRCGRGTIGDAIRCWTHDQNDAKPDIVFSGELERERVVAAEEAAKRTAAGAGKKKPVKPQAQSAIRKKGWKGEGRQPLSKEKILKIARMGDGQYTMVEVAKECGVTSGSIHYAVNKLRKSGIVMKFKQSAFGKNPAWAEALKELKDEQSAAGGDAVPNVDPDSSV